MATECQIDNDNQPMTILGLRLMNMAAIMQEETISEWRLSNKTEKSFYS